MPAYNSVGGPTSIFPGDSVQVLGPNDAIFGGTPYKSQQVTLTGPYGQAGKRIYVEGVASGAPGVFEVDIQESWTDSDQFYQTVQKITAVDANQHFGVDLTDVISGRFLRIIVPTWPNNVTLNATIGLQP